MKAQWLKISQEEQEHYLNVVHIPKFENLKIWTICISSPTCTQTFGFFPTSIDAEKSKNDNLKKFVHDCDYSVLQALNITIQVCEKKLHEFPDAYFYTTLNSDLFQNISGHLQGCILGDY